MSLLNTFLNSEQDICFVTVFTHIVMTELESEIPTHGTQQHKLSISNRSQPTSHVRIRQTKICRMPWSADSLSFHGLFPKHIDILCVSMTDLGPLRGAAG